MAKSASGHRLTFLIRGRSAVGVGTSQPHWKRGPRPGILYRTTPIWSMLWKVTVQNKSNINLLRIRLWYLWYTILFTFGIFRLPCQWLLPQGIKKLKPHLASIATTHSSQDLPRLPLPNWWAQVWPAGFAEWAKFHCMFEPSIMQQQRSMNPIRINTSAKRKPGATRSPQRPGLGDLAGDSI